MNDENNKFQISLQFILKVVLLLLLYASFWYAPDFYKDKPGLDKVTDAIALFLASSIIFSIGRYTLIALYRRQHGDRNVRGNFVLGIGRLTAVLNTVMFFIALMLSFGIDPRNFLTSLTFVAMAIAVTFREYITNMISGLFIMFSDSLSVGDRVKIGEYKGRIMDITFSSLIIQDEDEDLITVPNNLVFTMPVVNLSAHPSSFFTVRFELPLQGGMDVDLLEDRIKTMLRNHPNLTGEDTLDLKIMDIGKDFVKYKVDMHATSNSSKLHRKLMNEILHEVLRFKKEYEYKGQD
ncbi:Small-conductance mechanosensitive channel [Sphingobacterium psychroaquaticum]|uniref:Small-conductance mechanosensitive channel n=2 Tax=Sphingobacterium psychroaquaticum TaxID=561061 RepID=A0A1X7IMX6_9SPHI|nr:Small-conductance mechanosensitive channel [Sphingobacterium psychroaquaticum]